MEYSIEKTAIKNVVSELVASPNKDIVTEFLTDLSTGKHKEWIIFKHKVGELALQYETGYPTPLRKSRPSGNKEFGILYSRSQRVQIQNLPLHTCKTDLERAKMIMASSATPEVKMDLLLTHCRK